MAFPDFPSCFAGADTWEELPAAIQEAVQAHFYGEPEQVPAPSKLEDLGKNPEYTGGVWLLADIDLSRIDTAPMRLNISLPKDLVAKIDEWTNAHHMTRSGFLAKAAQEAMR